MTTEKNPGEGVPKDTPRKNILGVLEAELQTLLPDLRIAVTLKKRGYFDAPLMQQFDLVVETVMELTPTAAQRAKVLAAFSNSKTDRLRGYASGVAYWLYKDDPERCSRALYKTGTLSGTWAQESGQRFVKWLMRDHGVAVVLPFVQHWATDKNETARRLLIEAMRPLGVWTGHLKELRGDPRPLRQIIEVLLSDPARYVQLAVGNCINDISKDNPDLVCDWVKTWKRLGRWKSPEAQFVIRRGMRSLIRDSFPAALVLMGYADSTYVTTTWEDDGNRILAIGQALPASVVVQNKSTSEVKLRAQLILDSPGAGSRARRFVYTIKETSLAPSESATLSKRVAFKHKNSQPKLPGEYEIHLIVNGADVESRTYTYR